jgi:uncharacterized protein YjbJ (UPF0337 family)
MNWDQVAGNWKQFQGTVKEKWGKLTDDDLTVIAGKRDQLLGKSRRDTASPRKRRKRSSISTGSK